MIHSHEHASCSYQLAQLAVRAICSNRNIGPTAINAGHPRVVLMTAVACELSPRNPVELLSGRVVVW